MRRNELLKKMEQIYGGGWRKKRAWDNIGKEAERVREEAVERQRGDEALAEALKALKGGGGG